MTEIIAVIMFFMLGVWLGVWAYKIGRKHGIVIGRAQLAKEISNNDSFIDACKEEFEKRN
ncbi:hypothetical protein LCGC14_0653450 [marine sediment metagenome]|uniref:Uncharacterized protein n=1 Tax=marine sediment metagenome TaxID=412755 RepID=A0A0F9U444_9ZZZZ